MTSSVVKKSNVKRTTTKKVPIRTKITLVQPGSNFSDVEDSDNFIKVITVLVKEAGMDASREAEAAGISRTFVKGDKIVSLSSDKHQVVIKVESGSDPKYFRKIKAGTIFHAGKK